MARKKSSPAEDFMDLVALLPWWVGVALAAISFLVLHGLANQPSPAGITPGQMGQFVTRSLVGSLALVGQLVVPVLCLFGALGSYLRRKRRVQLVSDVATARSADALNGLSWREFELLVGEAFRMQGYEVCELGGQTADGGVDLELRKGRELFLVQCKQWKAFKVSVTVVRELYGVMARRGAAGGYVITSGTFTADATDFARGTNIRLVDGNQLFGLLQQARRQTSQATASRTVHAQQHDAVNSTQDAAPQCPLCRSLMVRRTAKKGQTAGSQFWGCARFPDCRGTRAI